MALKDTMQNMDEILQGLIEDLTKTQKGNKAAAQRVRTATLKLEKVGKNFRKESVLAQKSGKFKKKSAVKNPAKKKRK